MLDRMPGQSTSMRIVCPYPRCEFQCYRQEDLPSHIREHRNGSWENRFYCQFRGCTVSFSSSHDLRNHVKTHDPKDPRSCHICSKKYQSLQSLVRHQQRAHGPLGQTNEQTTLSRQSTSEEAAILPTAIANPQALIQSSGPSNLAESSRPSMHSENSDSTPLGVSGAGSSTYKPDQESPCGSGDQSSVEVDKAEQCAPKPHLRMSLDEAMSQRAVTTKLQVSGIGPSAPAGANDKTRPSADAKQALGEALQRSSTGVLHTEPTLSSPVSIATPPVLDPVSISNSSAHGSRERDDATVCARPRSRTVNSAETGYNPFVREAGTNEKPASPVPNITRKISLKESASHPFPRPLLLSRTVAPESTTRPLANNNIPTSQSPNTAAGSAVDSSSQNCRLQHPIIQRHPPLSQNGRDMAAAAINMHTTFSPLFINNRSTNATPAIQHINSGATVGDPSHQISRPPVPARPTFDFVVQRQYPTFGYVEIDRMQAMRPLTFRPSLANRVAPVHTQEPNPGHRHMSDGSGQAIAQGMPPPPPFGRFDPGFSRSRSNSQPNGRPFTNSSSLGTRPHSRSMVSRVFGKSIPYARPSNLQSTPVLRHSHSRSLDGYLGGHPVSSETPTRSTDTTSQWTLQTPATPHGIYRGPFSGNGIARPWISASDARQQSMPGMSYPVDLNAVSSRLSTVPASKNPSQNVMHAVPFAGQRGVLRSERHAVHSNPFPPHSLNQSTLTFIPWVPQVPPGSPKEDMDYLTGVTHISRHTVDRGGSSSTHPDVRAAGKDIIKHMASQEICDLPNITRTLRSKPSDCSMADQSSNACEDAPTDIEVDMPIPPGGTRSARDRSPSPDGHPHGSPPPQSPTTVTSWTAGDLQDISEPITPRRSPSPNCDPPRMDRPEPSVWARPPTPPWFQPRKFTTPPSPSPEPPETTPSENLPGPSRSRYLLDISTLSPRRT
ncbi:hypothetical protein BD410DRAFT_45032 [Rickenella mellea]|uniref:C2H2-type domain-containing protein n=1 Tax=Rickenella mellea TaxID=50990 RepID=A0A4R5XFG3_9AGAM|nr:hypothetical protein BD410DRAFT_45032 [Rickenella mellea]